MPHPTFDPHHECDRCRCKPEELAHLPSDEGIFLVLWKNKNTPSNGYYYLCNECIKFYVMEISIIEGPDATDDEEEDEEDEDEDEE